MKKKRFSAILGKLVLSVAAIFLLFYIMLPPLNIRSKDFFIFLILSIFIVLTINFLSYMRDFFAAFGARNHMQIERDPYTGQIRFGVHPTEEVEEEPKPKASLAKPLKYGFALIGIIMALMCVASLLGVKLFNATRYRDLIIMENGDFSADVAEISMNQIPVVDRDTATRLGSRKLGEMSELVSQFEIENAYTQINYQGMPYRVTPLAYADAVKWLFNMKTGLPAYITVNMVTQETDLVWLDSGMKYSPSEYFFRNIYRHLRFLYPTEIFESVSFEIDDNGIPYWVAPTVRYRIGWWDGKDIDGAILVNAITGESVWYAKDQVPQWIDQLYDSDMIITQLDDNGLFQNGYINSIFGQKNVRRTTYGHNYMALDDDVYLYTGMSSVTGDESNIGFVLVNLRTKATKFYTVPGATETSAMESAQGQVQHLKYSATFPLLLNISDRPTYFISLKDDAGLVKMYAFVDVEQYQIVGTGQTIDEARKNYRAALNLEDVETKDPVDVLEKSGMIESIADVVISGNTCYYFTLKGSDNVYAAYVTVNENLPFLTPGSRISFTYTEDETPMQVTEIQNIKLAN
ncbi:MAG: CvpA family protein [Lachnospiraceae bacterium]|nr:CvpA family protein [Lachnospiraceae bacterium]